ncbi:MAG: SUKH-4 family immunity protein [Lachnospiraceae bacterium]|nr:SUKH-4 family immunity protein [Lachnospiraceae bacterium]
MSSYTYLKNRFSLYKKEQYRSYALSSSTKRVPCDIGLPNQPLPFLRFQVEEVKDVILEEKYIVIGDDLGLAICLSLSSEPDMEQEVVSVDPEQEYPPRFVNKSLEALLEFIVIFLRYQDRLREEDDVESVLAEVRKEFTRMDIRALENEENWWTVILEQIELG